jgi:RNA polymerase primary sigma factor
MLLAEQVEFISHPAFDEPDAEERILRLPRASAEQNNDDSGIYALTGDVLPESKDERERYLFLRYNYCRRKVFQILARHNNTRLSADETQEVLKWEHASRNTLGEIVRENVPLVLAMAKRTRIVGVDLTDLISEGNLALLRSVGKFDHSRGYKFSTYACRAILKSFSRVATRTARYRGHFPTEFDPDLEKGNYLEQRRYAVEEDCVSELRSVMEGNGANLSDVERAVIRARFALAGDDDAEHRAKTLEQVGEMIGVTKERVRQIQNKALGKLRSALEDGVLAR